MIVRFTAGVRRYVRFGGGAGGFASLARASSKACLIAGRMALCRASVTAAFSNGLGFSGGLQPYPAVGNNVGWKRHQRQSFFVRIAARLNHVPSDLPSVDACGTARRLAVGSTREFDARRCVGRGCNIGHSDQPERFWLPWEVHTAQRDSRNPARPQLGQSPQACGWATSGPRYPGKWIVQSCLAIPGAVTAVHFPNTQGGKSRKSRITYYRCKDHLSFLVYRKSGVNIYVKYVMASSNQFTPKLFFVCVRDT